MSENASLRNEREVEWVNEYRVLVVYHEYGVSVGWKALNDGDDVIGKLSLNSRSICVEGSGSVGPIRHIKSMDTAY
ncbi:hypothetical protein Tco_0246758 [Tanacetum coccineum]